MTHDSPRSRFIKVKCNDCGNEQIIFGCASSVVHCLVCEGILARPTGGKCVICAQIINLVD